MDLDYKEIDKLMEKHDMFVHALNWDNENTYYNGKELIGNDWILEKVIAQYEDKEVIGVGSILPNYQKNNAELSIIIKPSYRKKGYGTKLLRKMLEYCKDELNVDSVVVNILKRNLKCIDHIEKNDFDFVSFDDEKITFQKKLINDK